MFLSKDYGKPQFMSFQHHALNRNLRVVMEEDYQQAIHRTSNISVKEFVTSYEEVQGSF